MPSLRHLRILLAVARGRLRRLHPFEVQAALTNRCDYRCAFCACPTHPKPEMDTRQWVETIRLLGRHGTLRIKFQGGEPTLRRDFGELCAAAREAGIIAGVVTHGGRIASDPSLLDHLDEVVLSIDSADPAPHDSLRGEGAHRRAMRAMELALAAGKRVYVSMVVCRPTAAQVEPLLALCESRGVGFHAQPLNLGWHYSDRERRELALDPEEIRALHHALAGWKRAGRPLMFSARTYEGVAAWPDHEVHTRTGPFPSSCMAGRDYIHIEPDGDVHPCGIHGGTFAPRNLVADGFEAAVENARNHDCADCHIAYLNERKALFGLRPGALLAFLQRR